MHSPRIRPQGRFSPQECRHICRRNALGWVIPALRPPRRRGGGGIREIPPSVITVHGASSPSYDLGGCVPRPRVHHRFIRSGPSVKQDLLPPRGRLLQRALDELNEGVLHGVGGGHGAAALQSREYTNINISEVEVCVKLFPRTLVRLLFPGSSISTLQSLKLATRVAGCYCSAARLHTHNHNVWLSTCRSHTLHILAAHAHLHARLIASNVEDLVGEEASHLAKQCGERVVRLVGGVAKELWECGCRIEPKISAFTFRLTNGPFSDNHFHKKLAPHTRSDGLHLRPTHLTAARIARQAELHLARNGNHAVTANISTKRVGNA